MLLDSMQTKEKDIVLWNNKYRFMPRSLRVNQYTDMAAKNQTTVLVQLKLDMSVRLKSYWVEFLSRTPRQRGSEPNYSCMDTP